MDYTTFNESFRIVCLHSAVILDYLFSHPMLFSRILQKRSKYLSFGSYNMNHIVSIFQNIKSKLFRTVIFCVFFDVKGLC